MRKINKNLRIEGEVPTKKDLDYMESAIQRHTGGFNTWWKQNCHELSGRDWLNLIITTWEAARQQKNVNTVKHSIPK